MIIEILLCIEYSVMPNDKMKIVFIIVNFKLYFLILGNNFYKYILQLFQIEMTKELTLLNGSLYWNNPWLCDIGFFSIPLLIKYTLIFF